MMNIVFCAQCSEGAEERSDCTMLKIGFCPQHSLKFGSKTSPQLNAVLRAGKCETLKVGSSCLNKIEFFSTQHKNLLLCLENPQFLRLWLGVGGAVHFPLHNLPIFIWSWAVASGPGWAPWAPSHRGGGQWRRSFGSGSICGALVPSGPTALSGPLKALKQHKVWTPRSRGGAESGLFWAALQVSWYFLFCFFFSSGSSG